MPPDISTFESILDEHAGAIAERPTLCVAWSGGLDSTVLLDLARRSRAGRRGDLFAVHVDHATGPDSTRHADFCRRVAARWQVPLTVESIAPVEGEQASEAELRLQRYAAIADAAEASTADLVMTAHQADDAVETALLNFVRGTGAAGFSTLSRRTMLVEPGQESGPIAAWPDLPILRPLLGFERPELREYAEERGLAWVTDPSNLGDRFARNRLRREVLPELRREAGSLEPMLRTLDNLAADAEAIEARVDELLAESERSRPSVDSLAFETAPLAGAAEAELTALLRRAAHRLPGRVGWQRDTLQEAAAAIAEVGGGELDRRRLSLRGAVLIVEPDSTTLARVHERGGRDLERRRAVPMALEVETPGSLPWFDRRIRWEVLEPTDPLGFPTVDRVAWFDADELPDRLEVRGPAAGETLPALGMESHKSVADILRAADVPRSRRWRWPCLAEGSQQDEPGECLWVCGLRQSRRGAVDASTNHVLAVEILSPDAS